jgi:hypothetical protein
VIELAPPCPVKSGRSVPDGDVLEGASPAARCDDGDWDFWAGPVPCSRSAEDDEAPGNSRELSLALTFSAAALAVALLPRIVQSDGSGSEPASGGTTSTEASSATANTGVSASARSSRSLRAS